MDNVSFPIVSKRALSTGLLGARRPPAAGPDVALVLVSRTGSTTLRLGDSLTPGEWRWGGYHTAYEVSMRAFPIDFRCDLPCKGDAFRFRADVRLTCKVSDPGEVVERQAQDVRLDLQRLVIDLMRPVSREYDIEDTDPAEKRLRSQLERRDYGIGLTVDSATISLDYDDEAKRYIAQRRAIARDTVIQKDKLKSTAEIETEADELDRKRARRELEREQEKFDREEVKARFYTKLMRNGDVESLVYMMMEHPDEAARVVDIIRQEYQLRRGQELKKLEMVLSRTNVEGWQVTEILKNILRPGEQLPSPEQPRQIADSGASNDKPKEADEEDKNWKDLGET